MMRKLLIITLLLAAIGPGSPLAAQGGASFKVVVNASNPAAAMSRAEVSRLFLKKTTRWERGNKVLPVDQLPRSSVRVAFSQAVHRKDVDKIKSYWQAQLFSGKATPPAELASDADILDYVRRNAGAIGYVSKSAVGDGVKVLEVTG